MIKTTNQSQRSFFQNSRRVLTLGAAAAVFVLTAIWGCLAYAAQNCAVIECPQNFAGKNIFEMPTAIITALNHGCCADSKIVPTDVLILLSIAAVPAIAIWFAAFAFYRSCQKKQLKDFARV